MADARASVAGETPEQTGERRDIATRFKPGQSGNPAGRKKGARARLAEAFIQDMYEAWQTRGAEVIQRVIEDRPHGRPASPASCRLFEAIHLPLSSLPNAPGALVPAMPRSALHRLPWLIASKCSQALTLTR